MQIVLPAKAVSPPMKDSGAPRSATTQGLLKNRCSLISDELRGSSRIDASIPRSSGFRRIGGLQRSERALEKHCWHSHFTRQERDPRLASPVTTFALREIRAAPFTRRARAPAATSRGKPPVSPKRQHALGRAEL